MLDQIFAFFAIPALVYLFAKKMGNIRITVLLDRRFEEKSFYRGGFCISFPNPIYPDTKFSSNFKSTE
jgi:hypothetical protein